MPADQVLGNSTCMFLVTTASENNGIMSCIERFIEFPFDLIIKSISQADKKRGGSFYWRWASIRGNTVYKVDNWAGAED